MLPNIGIYRILLLSLISPLTVYVFILKLKGSVGEKPNFVDALTEKCSVTNDLRNCPARDSPLTCAEFRKTFIPVCN